MRSRFRRQAMSLTPLPNFEDPAALRRENAARAGLSPQHREMTRDWWLREWPRLARVSLPAGQRADDGVQASRQRAIDMLLELRGDAGDDVDYAAALEAALFYALERKLRRSFGPPYEVDEDDPLLG
jgi:hypothetical protein